MARGKLYRYSYQDAGRWRSTTVFVADRYCGCKPSQIVKALRMWGYPVTGSSFVLEPIGEA